MIKRIRFMLVIGFFALMLVYCLVGLYLDLANPGSSDGWRASGTHGEFYIIEVEPQGPSKELRLRDRVLAINGVSLSDNPRLISYSYGTPPGTTYTMTVQRGDEKLTFTFQTVPRPPAKFPWSRLVPPVFWLTGLLVFLLKTEDPQARLLALTLGSFSGLLGGGLSISFLPDWLALVVAAARIAGLWSLPLLLHLFLIFPHRSPLLRRWPSLTKWIYAPLLAALPYFGVGRLPIRWAQPIASWPPLRWLSDHGLNQVAMLGLLVCLFAALLSLWLSYRTADVAGRRRLRVVMWGSLLGFGSLFLVIAMEFAKVQQSYPTVWNWLQLSTIFTLPLVPLSFAYAIVRHRVIPISLMIRRSVRYLLVSRGSVLLEGLVVALIVASLLSLLFRYLRPSGLTVGLISAATGIAAWRVERWLHHRFLAPVIDRKFFRQAYDAHHVLTELTESLRTTTEIPYLLEMVAHRVQAALQTESVTIFLREESTGDYRSAYACEYSAADRRALNRPRANRLPPDSATLAQLAGPGRLLELDGADPEFEVAAANGHSRLTEEERRTLREAKSVLLLPLKTKDTLSGVLALGSRLGDLPFSGDDKRLLQSVAASTSLALENAQLIERMLTEARRRQEIEAENEQRAKELEEARQLQLSMLPKSVPQLPQFEIAALMQTATEVGGDYYDFYVGEDGTLTIAVGDATGHGLKAGTMVAATKSLFNHLAAQANVVETLHDVSRALKLMNLRSLFMALTLVKVRGDRLHCSVAGMPPILVYRAAARTIEELPLRGVPLGGLSGCAYRQAEVTLAPNDVVLLMSDGLPERFNPASELFEYERIKETLSAHACAAPSAIAESLLRTSDEWADGRPLNDDLTLVVLKRKAAA
ncbi:MAG TPA: SpoIIE family protein phosphatase [Blastocatellia bacterium]|nr:SpoIIE family protein phosphatase [Blastocatellia bacterium]